MRFDDLLSRADDETLQFLLGKSALQLVTLLDPGLATPTKLRELVVGLRTRVGLLISQETRACLVDLLRPKEAEALATVLQISSDKNAYNSLKGLRIRSGSEREQMLFDFFEITRPTLEPVVPAPSMSVSPVEYGLFPHQRDAARKIKIHLTQGLRRVVLHMPTGSGKTRTTMNILADHLRINEPSLVIWLAYSEELCEQAAEEFEEAWRYLGNREIGVYRFWGDRDLDSETAEDGIIIAGLSKIYSAAKQSIQFISRLGSKTSLVVIDEAHSAVAETYKLILNALVVQHPSTGLLGLTATPGRTWSDIESDEELAHFFDRKKVTLQITGFANPVDYLVAEKYLAQVEYKPLFYEGGIELTEADVKRIQESLDLPETILKRLADDEMRNLQIILAIEELAKSHQRIIVFATTVEHSNILATVLRARGHQAKSITGNTPSPERARTIEEFKSASNDVRIICNYGVLTTGFDAPRTSAALIARPTKSLVLYSQMIGRAVRGLRAGGNETAEIVTVVDQNLPGFGSVSEAFNNWEDIWE